MMRTNSWRWLVALVSIALSVLAVEIVLRVMDAGPEGFYLVDPVRGWRHNPGFEGWYEEENRVLVRINSQGLRDREHNVKAAPGTIRIAVLGDSYMEAFNVPFEQSFAARLESHLTSCGPRAGRTVEVINFGVGGYGTAQEWMTYREDVARYQPDLVLLAVYTSNDIVENHRAFNEGHENERPFFVLRDGNLELLPPAIEPDPNAGLPWYQRWRLALTDRSLAANLLWSGYSAVRNGTIFAAPPPPPPATRPEEDTSFYVLQPKHGDDMREAWEVTEALFAAMAGEVKAGGSEFWMTTISIAEQVLPDVATRAALAAKLGVDSLFYPDVRIRDFARARGIPIVSLAEPLAEYSARTGEFLNGGYNAAYPPGRGHWNEKAHDLGARMVSDQLCAESRLFQR